MTPLFVVSGNCPEFSGPHRSSELGFAALGPLRVAVSLWI